MNEVIVTTIVSAITGLGGFIAGLKKDKQDLVTQSFNNILLQIQVYEQIIESLRDEIQTLTIKIESQQKIIQHLELKMEECLSPKSNI